MARRKRKEEESDWVAPEFDEVSYMRTEMQAARTAVVTIGWAVVGAIVSFLLYSVNPGLAFFAGIAVGFGMYFMLPMIGIDIGPFKRRDWIGHGVTYFFSWLAFWILLLNPPIGDFTVPTIQAISVSPWPGSNGYLECIMPVGGHVDLAPFSLGNSSIFVLFRASDNLGLASLRVTVAPIGGGSPFSAIPTPLSGSPDQCKGRSGSGECAPRACYPGGTFSVTFPAQQSSYTVTIVAADARNPPVSATVQVTT